MPVVGFDCDQINGAIRPSRLARFHDDPPDEREESQSQGDILQDHDGKRLGFGPVRRNVEDAKRGPDTADHDDISGIGPGLFGVSVLIGAHGYCPS